MSAPTLFPAFSAHNGETYWGPARLHPESIEGLLEIFAREGQHGLWLDLEEAQRKAGGIEHVPPFRRAA